MTEEDVRRIVREEIERAGLVFRNGPTGDESCYRGNFSSPLHFDSSRSPLNASTFSSATDLAKILTGAGVSVLDAWCKSIASLSLSTRPAGALHRAGLKYVGDIVFRTRGELRRIPNLGAASLLEIENALSGLGLTLGMDSPDWPDRRETLP